MPCSRSLGVDWVGGIPGCLAAGLQGGACSRGDSCSWGCLLWGAWSWGDACSKGVPPSKQTATVVDGMHPTGMHSCLSSFNYFRYTEIPHCYHMQRSCDKVMFSQASVSHSGHSGVSGRHSLQADTPQIDPPGQTPPRQTPPGKTPPGQTGAPSRHPLARHPPFRHQTGQTPPSPGHVAYFYVSYFD